MFGALASNSCCGIIIVVANGIRLARIEVASARVKCDNATISNCVALVRAVVNITPRVSVYDWTDETGVTLDLVTVV